MKTQGRTRLQALANRIAREPQAAPYSKPKGYLGERWKRPTKRLMFVMYVEHGNFLQILACILGGAGLRAGIFTGPHTSIPL